jgi:mRNA interferase MazF
VVAPTAGAVVLVKFPFSDLSRSKLRPAVVLADVGRGDRVLCQVTSKQYGDSSAVKRDSSRRPTICARSAGRMG